MKLEAITATAGCLLTVLVLAFDPFTQQVLLFPTSTLAVSNDSVGIAVSGVFGGTGASYAQSNDTILNDTDMAWH